MKSILFLILIVSSSKVFTQTLPCPPSGSPKPYTTYAIGEIRDVSSRTQTYREKKNPTITGSTDRKYTDSIAYSACGFVAILNKAYDNGSDKYSGIRIYIGQDVQNKFILFFVPTLSRHFDYTDPDDEFNYFKIVGNNAASVSSGEFDAATRRYANSYWQELTDNGKAYRRQEHLPDSEGYLETKAIWYNIVQIASSESNTHVAGLIDYLNNLLRGDSIDSIIVYFGAFQPTEEYNYQIDLVFSCFKNGNKSFYFGNGNNIELPQGKVTQIKSLIKKNKFQPINQAAYLGNIKNKKNSKININWTSKAYKFYQDRGGSFNTGIPCPPTPQDCATCSCNN